MTRLLSGTYADVLGRYAKLKKSSLLALKANPPKADKASRSRIARLVAVLVSLFMGMGLSNADGGSNHSFTPKDYIRSLLLPKDALCLIKLYGKESAFKTHAIGNLGGAIQTYGIPQLKNPLIANMSAYNQIDYGIKYVHHRYGSACGAYSHWLKKGWH